jgi:hypothetical protein
MNLHLARSKELRAGSQDGSGRTFPETGDERLLYSATKEGFHMLRQQQGALRCRSPFV